MSTVGGVQHVLNSPHGTAYTLYRVKILQNPNGVGNVM